MARFKDKAEFKKVFDRLFHLMSTDSEVGPKLRAAKSPQRFEFTDVGMTLNVRDADEKSAGRGQHLVWIWGNEKCDWEPLVTLQMTTDVANRYFQGKQNIAVSVATEQIVIKSGDMAKTLSLIPLTAPIYKKYQKMLKDDGLEHLIV